MRNQTSFRLTTTLLPTDKGADHKAKVTQVINKVDSDGNKFYPSFTNETVVLTNDDRTIMETTVATADGNGNITFVKRGLSDDQAATEIANRALTWNPGSIAFITVGAADLVDINDDLTWTGNQTYTGSATYQGLLVTQKGVKYPNFADETALQAYANPYGGMFATVDDTGELYRYNAVTEQWDLVSTVELGNYIIREDTTPPSGAADNVITLLPNSNAIYLGDNMLVENYKFADVLLAGGGAGYGCLCGAGGGGGVYLGERVSLGNGKAFCVSVGCAGTSCEGCFNGGDTVMTGIHCVSGGHPSESYWAGGQGGTSGLNLKSYLGGACGDGSCSGGGGGGGATGDGKNGVGGSSSSCTRGGNGGEGMISNITGGTQYYGYGGAGRASGTPGTTCCGYGVGAGSQGDACQGVAIVRYPTDGSYGIHCATGGTVTTCCGYTIHTFTADGTFCVIS